MGDNSEYRLLSISFKKPPKYGSVLTKDLTQRQSYITHNVQKNETLQGIALRYNVSMEKIKRSNNLWTSDSLFLRQTLNIPIDKPNVEEDSLNGVDLDDHQLYQSLNSTNSSNTSSAFFSNGNNSLLTNSLCTQSSNENNNNVDYKISLKKVQPDLHDNQQASTSNQNGSREMSKVKDESMNDFLSRIDQYIKQSKVKMDSFVTSSEIISSQSDDDIFKLHNYEASCHKPLIKNYGQTSLRYDDICLNEIRDKYKHNNREIIYSLKKLEKEQEEREKYEL